MFNWLRRLIDIPPPSVAPSADVTVAAVAPKSVTPTAPNLFGLTQGPTGMSGRKSLRSKTAVAFPLRELPTCILKVGLGHPSSSPESRQPRLRRQEDARWIMPGRLVNIHGLNIPGGMIYVGEFLSATPGGGWLGDITAPCLINPALKIARRQLSLPLDLEYWPHYSDITADQRLTYLTWLSNGGRDGSYPVGYAFLYFYGLERRLLVDAPQAEEEALIVAEITRLRDLYASNGSLASYSQRLMDVVELRRGFAGPCGLAGWRPDPATISRGSGMPLPLQIKLSLHALQGVPLDCEHATAAMLALPPYQGGPSFTIGMSRTRTEFIELVRQRFADTYPGGYKLTEISPSNLPLVYHSAAQHLNVELCIKGVGRLPDPALLDWTGLTELGTRAAQDLGAYAKLVGKDRRHAGSVEAAMTLPAEIAHLGAMGPFRTWLASLPGPVGPVPLGTLGQWCFGPNKEPAGLKQAREMSAMLTVAGYGMEPDPTHGGGRPDAEVFLFSFGDPASARVTPSQDFHNAVIAAHVLLSAEPHQDLLLLTSCLESSFSLPSPEAVRFAARVRTLRGRLLPPGKLKSLLGPLCQADRAAIAAHAKSAAFRGTLSQAVTSAVERLQDLCGVGRPALRERNALSADMQHRRTKTVTSSAEPVIVEQRTTAEVFRIPPPKVVAPEPAGLSIDMDKVDAILRETREVAEVLAPIYEEDAAVPVLPTAISVPAETPRFAGLGAGHAWLLEGLCGQETWVRTEFEARAKAIGLMPDGAIEAINEWAFDAFGDALIEDGDPLTINVALLPDAPEAST